MTSRSAAGRRRGRRPRPVVFLVAALVFAVGAGALLLPIALSNDLGSYSAALQSAFRFGAEAGPGSKMSPAVAAASAAGPTAAVQRDGVGRSEEEDDDEDNDDDEREVRGPAPLPPAQGHTSRPRTSAALISRIMALVYDRTASPEWLGEGALFDAEPPVPPLPPVPPVPPAPPAPGLPPSLLPQRQPPPPPPNNNKPHRKTNNGLYTNEDDLDHNILELTRGGGGSRASPAGRHGPIRNASTRIFVEALLPSIGEPEQPQRRSWTEPFISSSRNVNWTGMALLVGVLAGILAALGLLAAVGFTVVHVRRRAQSRSRESKEHQPPGPDVTTLLPLPEGSEEDA